MKTFPTFLFTFVAALLSSHVENVRAANILFYGAVGTHSTRISMFPLMEALANKGHSVTFLSSYDDFETSQQKTKINFYTPKIWQQAMGHWEDHMKFFDLRKAGQLPANWLNLQDLGLAACHFLYADPEFVDWVKSSKYDLVIMEGIVNDCAYGLVHMFKAKLVVYGTTTVFPWFPDAYGLPDETSTLTDVIFDFPSGDGMSFYQRLKNALSPIIFRLKRDYTYFPVLEETTRNGLGLTKDQLPSFREIEQNVSLVMLTTHFTIDLPRSLPPHVITIGGAVASNKHKPMSKEMEDFVNSAKNGLIYISFGTATEFTNFGEDVQQEFIQALFSFPDLKFLWKSSTTINATLPKNVMMTKWCPQQTVLGHANTKAFITHCGMGSITETVHFAVPAILLPVLAEQDLNANTIESRGAGIKYEITTLKKHEMEHAIKEIVNNKKYRENMKKLSEVFKDRQNTPLETAMYWLEYLLRHENSNEYLVPPSIRQSWWKRRQLDIWFSLFVLLSTTLLLVGYTIRLILRKVSGSSKSKDSKRAKLD